MEDKINDKQVKLKEECDNCQGNQYQLLKTVISSLSHSFYVVNIKDYSLALANEAALQGREISGLTCYKISHKRDAPCDGKEHGCPLEIIKKTKKPVILEHIHFDKDGNKRYVDVHGYPIVDESGKMVQMIEYCVDVSERKVAELDAQKKSKINRSILENSPFGIFVVNGDGSVGYVNSAMLEISGVDQEYFIKLNFLSHQPYKKIGLTDKIKKCLDGEGFLMEKIRYTSRQSNKTTVRNFIGLPLSDEDGKRALLFVEDITKEVDAEEEIAKRNSELEVFNRIAVDREIKMIELKKRNKILEEKLKKTESLSNKIKKANK